MTSVASVPVDLWTAMRRGWRGRCPRCGDGPLFGGFLKMRSHCPACGLVLARILIPAAAGARRRASASAKEGRGGIIASPHLSGALGLLGQLGTFSPALALMRRLIRRVSSKSRR